MARERRLGAFLLAGGCLPLALGAALPAGDDAPSLWCPFRAATGLPCPLCGGTRALVYAGHGDSRLWDYNAPWALLALAAGVAGIVALLAASRGRAPIGWLLDRVGALVTTPARVALLIASVAAVPWAYALAHSETITG